MAIDQIATVEVRVTGEEAKQELKNLEAIASGLKKELADAYEAGDTSKIKQVTSELRKTEAQIKTLKKDTTALTEVMNNLDKATPKELRATLTAINRQLNSGYIKRGSAEWKYYQQQAKLVTAELQKIKTEVQETESWISRFNNGLTKWGGLLATGRAESFDWVGRFIYSVAHRTGRETFYYHGRIRFTYPPVIRRDPSGIYVDRFQETGASERQRSTKRRYHRSHAFGGSCKN